MRRTLALALLATGLLATGQPAHAARIRSCPDVVVVPNSGDYWGTVRVVGVTCSYASRFLRRSSLPKGWRYTIVARNLPSMCGGDRVRFSKSRSRITASHSAC